MEIIAIFTHKYIMHGPGWFLHKSHHINYLNNKNKYELNDIYFIFFSSPSIICIMYGFYNNNYIILTIGIGILIYGLIYIFLHDLMVHQRFGVKIKIQSSYFKKIKKAHLKHHSIKHKDGATNFGFITYK
tara:strand:- start:1 stop:390 length:390 start_codon:yes stop_codon:yes gene_type:complete